jgi:hypothetical protein
MNKYSTFGGHANDSIGIFFHVKQLDHLIDICQLLLPRDLGGLSQESTKVQSLTNSGSREMKILLLNIACLALERGITLSAVYEHASCDNAHRGPRRKDIEKGSLAGSRNTLRFVSQLVVAGLM